MPGSCRKFTPVGRQKFEIALGKINGEKSSAEYSLTYLRSNIRSFLLAIAADEAIHPEIVRMQMGVFVKSGLLNAEVFAIPTKQTGLRIQSSEVHIAVPGVGKGM